MATDLKLNYHEENGFFYLRKLCLKEASSYKKISPFRSSKLTFWILNDEELYNFRVQHTLECNKFTLTKTDYYPDLLYNLRASIKNKKEKESKLNYNTQYCSEIEQTNLLNEILGKIKTYRNSIDKQGVFDLIKTFKDSNLAFLDIPKYRFDDTITVSEILNCFTEEFLELSREPLLSHIKKNNAKYHFKMDIES